MDRLGSLHRREALAGAAFAASLLAYVLVVLLLHPDFIDLKVYRVEGAAVRSHVSVYSRLHTPQALQATYPPFAALLFLPLTLLPVAALPAVAVAGNAMLLLVACLLSARLVGVERDDRVRVALLLAAVTLWAEPVSTTFGNGQINLLLLVLVLLDVTVLSTSRWQGVGIGLATAVKVTPAIFIVYLLLTRRFRAAAVAGAAMVATLLLSAAVLPHDTRRYWTSLVFHSGRVGHVEEVANQSLFGLWARVAHTRSASPAEYAVIGLVAVLGLACAALCHRRLGERWGVPACAMTALLVAPIAWSHHWVWLVPAILLFWTQRRAWLVPTVVVFYAYVTLLVPHDHVGAELHLSGWQQVLSGAYALWALAFLAAAARRAWRRPAHQDQDPTSTPAAVTR